MTKKLGLWILLIVVAIIAIGASQSNKNSAVEPQSPAPVVGARPGDETTSECNIRNGVTQCSYRRPLTTASTTPCAIRAPIFASSTLIANTGTLQTIVSSSTASTWVVAKSATAFATTTQLKSFSLGSAVNAYFVVNATTTDTVLATVFGPGEYLTWSRQGAIQEADTTKWTGSCQATFQTL